MKVSYIELLGEKHPMCFSLAASERIDEEFGSVDAMLDELHSKELRRIAKAADKVIQILMHAGRIYMSALGEPLPPPIPCRPADLIAVTDQESIQAIFSTMKEDSAQEVVTEPKNAEATQGL